MVAKKKTARNRAQDRSRVASGQDYEVRYEAKRTRKSAASVKKAVKKSRQLSQETTGQPHHKEISGFFTKRI